MFDLLLDESTNDLILENNDLVLTSTNQEALRQRLSIHLLMYRGEWFLNTGFGVPYMQQLIGIARTKETIDAVLRSEIALETTEDLIGNFTSTYDNTDTRRYTLSFDVYTANETLSVSVNSNPATEWVYPVPAPNDPNVSCDEVITIANDLYYFVNYDLPETGSSTWIKLW